MADEPKPEEKKEQPAAEPASTSPAPAAVAGDKPADGKDAPPPSSQKVQAEPLSDGTVPTVLTPGSTHISVPKGKTSLSTIYKKADILTTIFTFVGAAVVGALILGGYAYFSAPKTKATPPAKVSNLSQSDLSKLNDFFNGNSAGGSSQVLTISSSSLFNNRVAIASDLKVTGGVSVTGTTALGALTVDQNSTLGVTDVRGSLTVAGPANLQSPTTLGGGATVKGDLAVSGNGSFGNSISAGVINVGTLSVGGTLNLNGHLSIGGKNPSIQAAGGVATNVGISGNDSAGTISVVLNNTAAPNGADLATVTFSSGYPAIPVILITPVGRTSAELLPYISASATGFTIAASTVPGVSGTVVFNYWVVQY